VAAAPVTGAHLGQPAGDPPGGGDQERSRAHGRVAHRDGQQGRFGGWAVRRLHRVVQQRVQRGVEQAVNQAARRVVGAGGLALVAGRGGQGVGAGGGVVPRMQFQQRLVDAAELLCAQMLEVHSAQHRRAADGVSREQPDHGEDGLVRQRRAVHHVQRSALEQPTEPGQPELGPALLPAEPIEHQADPRPGVDMSGAETASGGAAQPVRREVPLVAVDGDRIGGRVQQGAAVVGDEPEQQPVDHPQQRAVVVGHRELVGSQPVAQPGVGRMGEEAGAEHLQRRGDLTPKRRQRPGAGVFRVGAPALQPPVFDTARLPVRPRQPLQPGLVADQEQQDEVAEQVTVEDRLQVELDVGLPDEGSGVAQQPQGAPVRQHRPEVVRAAVEQLLDHRLRRPGRTGGPAGAKVQVDSPTQQVHRHVGPQMADRVVPAVDAQVAARRCRHPAVVQHPQQRLQPPLPGQPGSEVAAGSRSQLVAEAGVDAAQVLESAGSGLPQRLAGQVVVIGRQPGQIGAGDHAGQQVGRQQRSDTANGGIRTSSGSGGHAGTAGR
jgi:hypothetical protein